MKGKYAKTSEYPRQRLIFKISEMKIMKSIKVKLEKDYKTPFDVTLKAGLSYDANIDGNGTVKVDIWNPAGLIISVSFVKGTNIIIL